MSYGNDNGKWVRVGSAPVDSGTMMLVDPCYVLPDKRDTDEDEKIPLEYSEALGFEHPTDHPESYASRDKARANGDYESAYALGGRGKTPYGVMGWFFDTNWGDGSYPVFARIAENGRTTGVYISFADSPEEDEWDIEDEVDDLD
jgi:hypothetical protein